MTDLMYIKHAETMNIVGDRIVLYYFVHERSLKEGGEGKRYGIGIDMYTQLQNERTVKESKVVEGIFATKAEAEVFADILCRGYVTPTTLEDVIEDNVAM